MSVSHEQVGLSHVSVSGPTFFVSSAERRLSSLSDLCYFGEMSRIKDK